MRKWWKDNWNLEISWLVALILAVLIGWAIAGLLKEAYRDDQRKQWLTCRDVQRQIQEGSLWAQDAFKAWDCKEILEKVKVD